MELQIVKNNPKAKRLSEQPNGLYVINDNSAKNVYLKVDDKVISISAVAEPAVFKVADFIGCYVPVTKITAEIV